MRQLFLSAIILLSALPVPAAWQVGIDMRSADSAFMGAVRLDAEISYRMDSIRLSLPLRFSCSLTHEVCFAETSILVSVYPLDGRGLFIGASMVRAGYFWGLEAPSERFILFSEIVAGWTFSFSWFFLEPRLSILDAFSAEEGRLSKLEEAVPQYSKLRISLLAGLYFD